MIAKTYHCIAKKAKQPLQTSLLALVVAMSNVGVQTSQAAINVINTSQVGSGFTVTAADLAYILKQIKIAEYHVANTTSETGLCGALLGSDPNQIPSPLLSFGLRTVDGSCNNLQQGQDKFGAADQTFPRLTTPVFNQAETNPPIFGPPGPLTSYAQTTGSVFDSQPRLASNLIVDQTSTNPAAVEVAGNPFRTQGNDGVVPCDTVPGSNPPVDIQPLQPAECVPQYETLFIPNVTTDVGLSPPFNSLFTIFGQFFDHGLDKITNSSANGTVFVPLKEDDPLVAGPDHILLDDPSTVCIAQNDPVGCDESDDNLAPNLRFMVLTRGKIAPGADGFRNALNTDTPFVDQSQTYTSHASHQVFMRDYTSSTTGPGPFATGKFLSEPDGGIADWKRIKANAAQKLGMKLVDADVTNIPAIETDLYGNFVPGPHGFPQYVTNIGLVEGDPSDPVKANCPAIGIGCPAAFVANRIETAFLNDIAHSADPGSLNSPKLPDGNNTAGGSLDILPSGVYDDELLDLHFICGDGRCNENIGLTAIHQIFHMEHDRLVDDIKATLNANPTLKAEYEAVNLTAGSPNKTFRVGERLFQAARFVTEMQYQHLVFEEFARKVQPAINPFEAFAFGQTDLDPAITAEFAHAVYRFGHSMLNETLPRPQLQDENGIPIPGTPLNGNDIGLLEGFLNPAAFYDGGNGVTLTSSQATATLIMGLSDQVGNEIDEFVTETLRNHLLGLPLDLPSINMARARSEGIPSLNNVRKQIFAATNDGQLTPYANWVDFDQAIKNHSSLVNFIAAYGKHPTIRDSGPDGLIGTGCGTTTASSECADNNTTLLGKRAAAKNIVDGVTPDSGEFMFSTGVYANVNGVSQTGVDDIDLWVGGLAENTNVFGGLLGPTFNYVFEKQLTDLQNGDRFYYLARTPGMNLRSQLEGNSFSELVLRNTNPYTHTLKADPFATADCKFELGRLTWPAVSGSFITGAGSVNDDPLTECNENRLLIRSPTGRIQYRSVNSVDPLGINGQAVYNGTNFADDFFGGNDNDTFWGGLGDDKVEGGGGDDVVLGGEGDDIITDLSGADFLKGGPGNDAIDGGIGDDIIIAGDGHDFTNGGGNLNETFSGEGNDFAIAGQGTDAVFGDSGDDWMEGGDQPDLLIGDSSSLFFDDHNLPGHDVLIGQGGDDDYDMEGGDDIGVGGPGVEKVAGASGYDWSIGLGDPQPQNADLALLIVNAPPANEVRDRYNEIEALSGWNFNDILRGDNIVPSAVGGLGFIGCDALDADGVARITGLELLVTPALRTVDPAPIIEAASRTTQYCGLQAESGFAGPGTEGGVWGEGNIILGGAGSDTLEGRGGNDILDGDKYLNVRLSVRAGADDPNGVDTVTNGSGVEIGSTGLMENAALTGTFGPSTSGMTLQQAVFARKVNPGNILTVREILRPAFVTPDCSAPAASRVNCDKAEFSGPLGDYTITANADGSVIVADNGATVQRNDDGIDILWNMEQLSFCPAPGAVQGTCDTLPNNRTIVTVTPTAVVRSGSLAFGNQTVGTTVDRVITIGNNGVANLNVTAVSLANASPSITLLPGSSCIGASIAKTTGSCTFTVRFSPTAQGVNNAQVVLTHNGVGLLPSIPVSGTGTVPVASVSVSSVDFGSTAVGVAQNRSIILSNTGLSNLSISSVAFNNLTGAGAGASFSRQPGGCGTTLQAGGTCLINLRFQPTLGGSKTGTLSIFSNSNGVPGSRIDVSLSGVATIAANADAPLTSVTANQNAVQNTTPFAVRNNDVPAGQGTVAIVGLVTITNPTSGGGATAIAEAVTAGGGTTPPHTHIRFRLTAPATATTPLARQNSKKATYTVTYRLINGDATADATYTLTVN